MVHPREAAPNTAAHGTVVCVLVWLFGRHWFGVNDVEFEVRVNLVPGIGRRTVHSASVARSSPLAANVSFVSADSSLRLMRKQRGVGIMVDQIWRVGKPSMHALVKAIAYYAFLVTLPFVIVDSLLHLFVVRQLPEVCVCDYVRR